MTQFTNAADELKNFKKANAQTQIELMTDAGIGDDDNIANAKLRVAAFTEYVDSKTYEVTDVAEETVEDAPETDAPSEDDGDEICEESEEESEEEYEDDLGDEVVCALSTETKNRLAELSDEILLNHKESIFVPEDMPTQKDRRENKYSIGAALKEARGLFPSDKQFGDWVLKEINDPLLEQEQKPIPQKTLFNYRKLAEFGACEDCESIGFTNVYKLSQEGNEENLAQVQLMLSGEVVNEETDEAYTSKELALHVKGLFGGDKPKTYSQEQVDAMLDGYIDEDALEEMREDTQVDAMTKVYLEYFGIEEDEFTMETIKVQHRASMKRFHPDHHGNSYISDYHFANNAFEFLRKRLL